MKLKHCLLIIQCALLQTFVFGVPVYTSEAPVNTLELTVGAINKAKNQILLNVYELSSPEIQQALLKQISKGVEVRILLEGEPFSNSAEQREKTAKSIQDTVTQFSKAMRSKGAHPNSRFFVMTAEAGGKRRYRWDHAKYIVVDQSSVLIGSENYSPTGQPAPGTVGNRGWEVFILDPKTAAYYKGLFQEDTNLEFDDVIEYSRKASKSTRFFELVDETVFAPLNFENLFTLSQPKGLGKAFQIPQFDAQEIDPFSSPIESQPGLLSLINSAEQTLDIEQMSFPIHWGNAVARSPLFEAVLKAARKNVKVRVLLNDPAVFGTTDDANSPPNPSSGDPKGNTGTVALLNQIAKTEGLQLEARIVNVSRAGITYIHNKGALVDGSKTLISSINWTGNAVTNNRETAAVLYSPQIFDHYQADFNRDWIASKGNRK